MERATPRRRNPREGSLTVAELLAGDAPAGRRGAFVGTDRSDAGGGVEPAVSDTGATAANVEGHGRLATAGRATGLGIGVLTLCGAIGAASLIAGQHDRDRAGIAIRPASSVTGAQALRPDKLAARLPGSTSSGSVTPPQASVTQDPHSAASRPGPAPRQDDRDAGGASVGATSGSGTTGSSTATLDAGTAHTTGSPRRNAAPVDVVGRFYRLLGERPEAAARLLDPRLLGSGALDFVRSWTRTQAIHVEQVTQRSQHTVEAVVRVLRPDGSWLRLRQLVRLAGDGSEGTLPRIADVTLLSAQRG